MRNTISYLTYKLLMLSLLILLPIQSSLANDHYYNQIKLGGGLFDTGGNRTGAPIVCVGGRVELGDDAVDISAAWAENDNSKGDFQYYSLPKITYVKFHEPQAKSSFFYGGGLSYSSLKKDDNKFSGVFGEATIGYEFKRHATICPIVYVDVSQPLLADSKQGQHPGPSVIFGMSVGF